MNASEKFRQETRDWLDINCPESQREPVVAADQFWGGTNPIFASEDAKIWFERMRDNGYVAPEWPEEYGGAALDVQQAKILKEEMKRIKARPPLYGLGLWMLGPALLEYGNEQQKQLHLNRIVQGQARWCQGYSEPGAGSDLASLQCKAEDKGDHFLINGSKIWTTKANECNWIFCLVRTNTDVKKQEGISFLLIDMENSGVTTKPIVLISGESEFCQTFFDNVKVPKENLVGELNKGWSVAKALLKHERKLMSELGSENPRLNFTPAAAARQYKKFVNGKLVDTKLRTELTNYDMDTQAITLTHQRIFEEHRAGIQTSLPTIMKFAGTELEKRRSELNIALMGSQGMSFEGNTFTELEKFSTLAWAMSKTTTIAGGSSEVQLNIVSKRILGLPES